MDDGKSWIKKKWQDTAGDEWGNQTIQGQHEWIKTDLVNYVILNVVNHHGGANLEAWLSACEMLRIPTADVSFQPVIQPGQVEEANRNPGDFTASSLGEFSGHVGAYYRLRRPGEREPKDPQKDAYRASTTGEKKIFHTPLDKLLKQHLNKDTNDLPGFLAKLRELQSQTLWGGDIPNLTTASQIPNDYRARSTASATLRGQYTSSYDEKTGLTTTFVEANTVADLQNIARGAKERNEAIMDNRVNAIVQQWHSSNVPQPLSNFRMQPVTLRAYTVDPTNKSVADYDRDLGYDAFQLEPVAYGGDVQIEEDMEADEEYSAAPNNQPTPAPAQTGTISKEVLEKFGQARSALTQEVEANFKAVTTEVQQLFNNAYQAEIKGLTHEVDQALQRLDTNADDFGQQKAVILQQAGVHHQAITQKYRDEASRQFEQYIDKKHKLDVKLREEETRQTTPQSLQKLVEAYLQAVNNLLSSYIADMKSVLNV